MCFIQERGIWGLESVLASDPWARGYDKDEFSDFFENFQHATPILRDILLPVPMYDSRYPAVRKASDLEFRMP